MRIVLLLGEWTCYRDIEEKGHPRWSKPVPTSRRQDSPSSGYSHSPQDGDFVRFDGHFTGNAMADFLLGDAQSYSQLNQRLTPYYDYYQIELYAQDTWRVTPRLTVNIGVR